MFSKSRSEQIRVLQSAITIAALTQQSHRNHLLVPVHPPLSSLHLHSHLMGFRRLREAPEDEEYVPQTPKRRRKQPEVVLGSGDRYTTPTPLKTRYAPPRQSNTRRRPPATSSTSQNGSPGSSQAPIIGEACRKEVVVEAHFTRPTEDGEHNFESFDEYLENLFRFEVVPGFDL
ncbi:hypothetical protein B0H11DRAFT_2198306 [Mycena galericulata]|nr:hypothetical protein B0H11DRAFT_2198306 [Mycena galericulata]